MTYPLFIDESPIQVLPSLARRVGLSEAVILQEIHYWLTQGVNTDFKEGQHWVLNVEERLHQQFPFWDVQDIEDRIAHLEDSEVLMMLAPPIQGVKMTIQEMSYHTINYKLLRKKDDTLPKAVPVTSIIQDILSTMNQNMNALSSFKAEVHTKSPHLYTMVTQDLAHSLACELVLEIHDHQSKLKKSGSKLIQKTQNSKEVTCHFPMIDGEPLKKIVGEDPTLYGILMTIFQMKILEQLLLFCSSHHAANLVIYADDGQAEELEIYRAFLIHQDQTITSAGEKAEMTIPADQETFEAWIDFIELAIIKFCQILWREQKTNSAIHDYLKSQQLPEI